LYGKFSTTDLQDFRQNVQAGAYFLARVYTKYGGDVDKVLMCYHLGEGGAKRKWAAGVYTDGYCNNVKKEMARIIAAGYLDEPPV
ncbi:MAG: transglycosylase SLT domain-containing protein, partial [Clostridia bacterium]|nr:transglycosylase SLT domain-containing protein [Clostridia bacterium]